MAFDIPTVGELIRRLQEFPPESPVGTFDALAPACRIYEVTAHESGVVVITGSDSPMYGMECSAQWGIDALAQWRDVVETVLHHKEQNGKRYRIYKHEGGWDYCLAPDRPILCFICRRDTREYPHTPGRPAWCRFPGRD